MHLQSGGSPSPDADGGAEKSDKPRLVHTPSCVWILVLSTEIQQEGYGAPPPHRTMWRGAYGMYSPPFPFITGPLAVTSAVDPLAPTPGK